jgi:hypothetical protein
MLSLLDGTLHTRWFFAAATAGLHAAGAALQAAQSLFGKVAVQCWPLSKTAFTLKFVSQQ